MHHIILIFMMIDTLKYITFLQNLVNNSNYILDLGCGDFNYTSKIDFKNKNYLGIDCVESVINKNIDNFGNNNINFLFYDIQDYSIPKEVDLIIIKDVLQHWNNDTIIIKPSFVLQ